MNQTQRTVGTIAGALIIGHSLGAQDTIRPSRSYREDTSTVTLQELQHNVPRRARAEMERVVKASLKNQRDQELDHLRKAILIDPEYIAARNNLGVRFFETEPAAAIAQWEAAIKVNPRKGLLFNNLAVGFLQTRNLELAERAARMSIELDKSDESRALLGVILYEQHKYTAETCELLETVTHDYPSAHVLVASVLAKLGDFRSARTHIETYLSSGETKYRKDAFAMLDFLDHGTAVQSAAVRGAER